MPVTQVNPKDRGFSSVSVYTRNMSGGLGNEQIEASAANKKIRLLGIAYGGSGTWTIDININNVSLYEIQLGDGAVTWVDLSSMVVEGSIASNDLRFTSTVTPSGTARLTIYYQVLDE